MPWVTDWDDELNALDDAGLFERCKTGLRICRGSRLDVDRLYLGALWRQCCNRGKPEMYERAVAAVNAEIRANREANRRPVEGLRTFPPKEII